MVGIVVVTHGQLSIELLNATQMIVGDLPRFTAVSLGLQDQTDDARNAIAQAITRVDQNEGVLLLTDMFGGTPSKLAMTFLGEDNVEVLTGVNLPMLISLANRSEQASLLDVAREARDRAQNAVWVASDLLRGNKS